MSISIENINNTMVIIHIDYLLSTSISPTDNKARTTDKLPE